MTQAVQATSVEFDLPITGPATVPWRYLAATEHAIEWLNAAGNVLSSGLINSDFAITPSGNTLANVGTMTLLVPPPANAVSVRLFSVTTPRQDWVAPPAGTGIEAQMDRMVRVLQELRADMSRTLRSTDPVSAFAPQPGNMLAFDEDNQPIVIPAGAFFPAPSPLDPLFQMIWLDDLDALDTNTSLTLVPDQPGTVTPGNWIGTRREVHTFQVAAADAVTHDRVTAGGIKLYGKGPADRRRFANDLGGLNFFDFLSHLTDSQRTQICLGTYTASLHVELQAFIDALLAIEEAGGWPRAIFPSCVIPLAENCNWGVMNHLTIETRGWVHFKGLGNAFGFYADAMGRGYSFFGVVDWRVGPIVVSSETGTTGSYIRRVHYSKFEGLYTLGGSLFGNLIDGCMLTEFYKTWFTGQIPVQVPGIALYVTGSAWQEGDFEGNGIELGEEGGEWRGMFQASWCLFSMPTGENCPIAMRFDAALGCRVEGGVAQRISNIGLFVGPGCYWLKTRGFDIEETTNHAIWCEGGQNTFDVLDSGNAGLVVTLTGVACSGNVFRGGKIATVNADSDTSVNLFDGTRITTIADASIGRNRNRYVACTDDLGNWRDGWTTPVAVALSRASGVGFAATATAQRRVTAGDTTEAVVRITVTAQGTGGPQINVTLPTGYAPADGTDFHGYEPAITGQAVAGFLPSGGSTLTLTLADGTFAGATGAQIVVRSTYQLQ